MTADTRLVGGIMQTSNVTDGDYYMRSREMASYLRIGQNVPATWRVKGFGPPYIKVGGTVLYRRSDVDGWAAGFLRNSTSKTA
jgi:hypothetical protein